MPPQHRQFIERQSIGALLKRAGTLLTRRLSQLLAPHDLTPNQWVVLACLWRQDALPVTYIAEQVGQIGGTLTGVLDRMEKRRLVKRKRDANDRRVYRVCLTESGAVLLNTLPNLAVVLWAGVKENISEQDLTRFSELVDRISNNLFPAYKCVLPECGNRLSEELSAILPPKSLGYRMRSLSMQLTRRFSEKLEVLNVTTTHWLVLCRLWREDGIPVSEISNYIELEGGSLAGVLERMEDRKLITRRADPADKRRMLVFLTDDGDKLFHVLPEIALENSGLCTSGLTEDEVHFMTAMLNALIVNLTSGESISQIRSEN
ncbi:MAG: MarR family transcriptional regulator [Leptolyngbya sp.]|nr:MarR family transcriptional regulator [Candidatus Melainabacteria bacterium]